MQAAQILAGYSLGDADLLRRAMGKKVQAEMDIQRERFVTGCKEVSGIEKAEAKHREDVRRGRALRESRGRDDDEEGDSSESDERPARRETQEVTR